MVSTNVVIRSLHGQSEDVQRSGNDPLPLLHWHDYLDSLNLINYKTMDMTLEAVWRDSKVNSIAYYRLQFQWIESYL